MRGVPAFVVMPETAPRVKVDAVAGYGAEIRFCAPTLAARESTLADVLAATGAVEVHPYDDDRIIAGQATATLELLNDVPDLDLVMTPIGGGGLSSGAALAVRYLAPGCEVVAAEPEGADDAYRSWRSGQLLPSVDPRTIADGLLTSLSDRTFAIVRRWVREIVTVSDADTVAAMRLIWERMKLVVEPSAAVPLGALLAGRVDVSGRRVGIVLSGGNVDLDRLPWMAGERRARHVPGPGAPSRSEAGRGAGEYGEGSTERVTGRR
jgi:threonine dehydratase